MASEKKTKISVIIPAYNQAQFLGHAITSVLDQTYQDFEIIVVDDGSQDQTREVAQKFGELVKYIWQENKGLAGARNTGIQAARGDYIGLLDSDDEWMPEYLEKMVALASGNPDAAVFYCMAQSVDVNGRNLPQLFGGPANLPSMIYQNLVRANFLIPSTILMRTDIIKEAGLFDENLRSCEDWDLWLRLLPEYQIVGIDDCLVKYRIHGSSLSTDPSGMQTAARATIEKNFGAEDSDILAWSDLKKRAYGGLYLYHAWTSILRKGDWEAGGDYLEKALVIDAELRTNLDIFYEILLGRQPIGFRGTNESLHLEGNIGNLELILNRITTSESLSFQRSDLKNLYGTAYYATGLLAYNTSSTKTAKKYFLRALRFRKDLILDRRFIGLILKSLLPIQIVEYLKRLKNNS